MKILNLRYLRDLLVNYLTYVVTNKVTNKLNNRVNKEVNNLKERNALSKTYLSNQLNK
jgi:hypothetical protein